MDSTKSDDAIDRQAPHGARPPNPRRQVDPVDRPARPLGAKRSALQAQRRRQAMASWRTGLTRTIAGPEGRMLTSADGTLAFALLSTTTGLLVERRHCPANGPRTAQTMMFDDATQFDRWCESEPVRFNDPMLHGQLRREGHEALDADR